MAKSHEVVQLEEEKKNLSSEEQSLFTLYQILIT